MIPTQPRNGFDSNNHSLSIDKQQVFFYLFFTFVNLNNKSLISTICSLFLTTKMKILPNISKLSPG